MAASPCPAPSLCFPLSRGNTGVKAAVLWGPPWGFSSKLVRFLPQWRGEQGSGGVVGRGGGLGLEIVTRGSLAHCLVHFLPSAS